MKRFRVRPRTTVAVLVGLASVFAPLHSTAAQAPSENSATAIGIEGFLSVRWGADSASIVRAMGPPDTIRTLDPMNAKALVYADHQLGRTLGSLGFLVRPEAGLVRVQYLTEYGTGERCLEMYQSVRDSVAAMIPGVARRERMYNHAEGLSFCTAFQLGRAGARSIWRDPESGARSWVALDLETGVVRVSFESSGFRPFADGSR